MVTHPVKGFAVSKTGANFYLPIALLMRWEIIKTEQSGNTEYHLTDGTASKATLRYNAALHSFRIRANDTQRMFFVEHTGFLRNKTVLKNEYGVIVGKLGTGAWYNNIYHVEIDGEKYHIAYRNNPLAELVVYKKSIHQPLVSCALDATALKPQVHLDTNDEVSALLLGLCWYLFLPVAKEHAAA